jgi:hypothetical protein
VKKNLELYEYSSDRLFDMGLDAATCVRFMDWIAKKDRERFGDTSFGAALEEAVIAGENALEVARHVGDLFFRRFEKTPENK